MCSLPGVLPSVPPTYVCGRSGGSVSWCARCASHASCHKCSTCSRSATCARCAPETGTTRTTHSPGTPGTTSERRTTGTTSATSTRWGTPHSDPNYSCAPGTLLGSWHVSEGSSGGTSYFFAIHVQHPSGENAADITASVCPVRVCTHSPDAADNILAADPLTVRTRSPSDDSTPDIT